MQDEPLKQIRRILDACTPDQRHSIIRMLRTEYRAHRIEQAWNTSAEIVLEALARSSELTQRMFKGILAEAAFKVEIVDNMIEWQDVTPLGTHPFDFAIRHGQEYVTIQVKLQRKQAGKPLNYRQSGRGGKTTTLYVVETQKTRGGTDSKSGEDTRPYRFGEFDILAVSMEPSTADWSQFRFTVANWLIPRPDNPELIATLQPVSLTANDDWTDSLADAIKWLQSEERKIVRVE
ncbi:MAG: hypothetical protein GC162_16560 [Planctomycetes bacterium]|nr:hypothetical protein [Planctomycetota bacterium]